MGSSSQPLEMPDATRSAWSLVRLQWESLNEPAGREPRDITCVEILELNGFPDAPESTIALAIALANVGAELAAVVQLFKVETGMSPEEARESVRQELIASHDLI